MQPSLLEELVAGGCGGTAACDCYLSGHTYFGEPARRQDLPERVTQMKMSQRLSQTQLRQVVCSKRGFHRRCYLDISLDMGLKMPGEGHIVRRTWKSIASNIKSAMRRQWVAVGTLVPFM